MEIGIKRTAIARVAAALGFVCGGIGLLAGLTGCASSFGSPPAVKRMPECVAGQTLVCTSRSPSAQVGDESIKYDTCRCELQDRIGRL